MPYAPLVVLMLAESLGPCSLPSSSAVTGSSVSRSPPRTPAALRGVWPIIDEGNE
jgi:hypothetical protein